MSGGGWKEPFYKVAELDSQNLKHLAQMWNLPWLEEEAARNEKNPGRAITKAAEYAAAGYLGGLYGGLYDTAGAYAAATPALKATGEGSQAAMLAAQTGDFGAQGLAATAASGGSPYADALAKLASGSGSTSGGKQLAMQMGLQQMQPQQQQQPMAPPPRQQAPAEPLPTPYGPNGNSTGLLSLQEIERRKRLGLMGGYR